MSCLVGQAIHPFPHSVKCSLLPNLDILEGPIGDYLYCSKFIADKCAESKKLILGLTEVAEVDLHVAVTLLHMCGSFCRMVHIARVTPSSLLSDALEVFDEEVRNCFMLSTAIEISQAAWSQAQLSLRFGDLGFERSLIMHRLLSFHPMLYQVLANQTTFTGSMLLHCSSFTT